MGSRVLKKNLLPIGVGEIAVGFVTGFLSFTGFVVAIGTGIILFSALGGAAGALVALLVVAVLIVLIIALSMYVTTAYHTCLFLWARNVEDAKAGISGAVRLPVPIANAMGIQI